MKEQKTCSNYMMMNRSYNVRLERNQDQKSCMKTLFGSLIHAAFDGVTYERYDFTGIINGNHRGVRTCFLRKKKQSETRVTRQTHMNGACQKTKMTIPE